MAANRGRESVSMNWSDQAVEDSRTEDNSRDKHNKVSRLSLNRNEDEARLTRICSASLIKKACEI